MSEMTAAPEGHNREMSYAGSVSVLVPMLNEAASLQETIDSLVAQDYQGDIEFILVDGGSTDGTVELIREVESEDHRFNVLDNPARVTPAALNLALNAARGEIVARMDCHNIYPPNYLRSGIERLTRGDVASVSGPALPSAESPWSRRVALALRSWLGTGDAAFRHPIDAEIEVDSGFSGVWLQSTLSNHGGWDEDTYPNEDAELAARIRASGDRIVCIPEMAARYIPRDSLSGLARQYWRYGQFRARTAVRQPNSLRRSHVLAPSLALALVAAPLPLRMISAAARGGLMAYLATNFLVSASKLKSGGRDALTLPLIFATMHLTWGFGFLRGMIRFGVPAAAVRALVRRSEPSPESGRCT